jgi:hypothetical protein
VIRKLGTTVIAGSQACDTRSGLQGGSIEAITRPSGRTFPRVISKMPCSGPPNPAKTPSDAARTQVSRLIGSS